MAAATASSSTIDFKSQATFPIRLGSSILKPSTPAQLTSVRYNHRPKFKTSEHVKATIKEGDGEGESKLLVEDAGGEYKYAGRQIQDDESYVLVVRGQGKDREMVLERMGSSHGFNLISTPSQRSASVLAEKYPPLPQDNGDDDDLFGDEDEDTPPDDSNPFDYRHFLKAELEKQHTAKETVANARSNTGTPLVRHQAAASSTPVSRPAKPAKKTETKAQAAAKKRKAPAAEKPNPKRVKAGQEPPPPAEPAKPKARPEVPKISLDRKASLRRPSMDDSGELILENETPISEKPPKHNAMAMALTGQLGGGPISLRSAASTPGSQIASPMPPRPEGMEEEYVFEFDDSPEPTGSDNHAAPDANEDADVEEDEEDADVEDLELPSPAQNHRQSVSAAAANNAGDDDDDLDKQLALAMMEEDDGANQESEESEEE